MTTQTRTQTTKPAALWITREGRITCVEHGGMALAAAVEARPERLAHVTDLDDWQAVTAEHVEQWAAQMGKDAAAEVARCETCRMQAPVVVTDAETWAGYRPDKIIAIPTTP